MNPIVHKVEPREGEAGTDLDIAHYARWKMGVAPTCCIKYDPSLHFDESNAMQICYI